MPGGCWICNPMCGKCQPAPIKSTTCKDCGTLNLFERPVILAGEALLCKKCGRDLSDEIRPKPVLCNYSGYVCAYPCGNSKVPEHGNIPCERNTPPDEEWLEEHPKMRKYVRLDTHQMNKI